MIRFECRCHHLFEVPEQMAGDSIQCPQCGLLNDVPVLSQLASLDEHGNYKVGADTTLKEPDRMDQLHRAFAKTNIDEEGNEIDLRQTVEDLENVGSDEGGYNLADDSLAVAPKYDPITGELIRPIEVDDQHAIPAAPIPVETQALEYARNRHVESDVTPARALALLFTPENVIVIFFCYLIATIGNLVFTGPIALLAHFANVIDETGPDERDEMPRPFRNLSLSDDLWGPFVHFFFALMYAYSPVLAIGFLQLPPWPGNLVVGIVALICSIFFPGILLTNCTSGTIMNLRPDIVMMTIARSGKTYFWTILLWIAAITLYADGCWATLLRIIVVVRKGTFGTPLLWVTAHAELMAGIILMHYFCWLLGLIYRKHHEDFPWLMQRHIRVNAREAGALIDARLRNKQHRREQRQAMRGRI